MNPFTEIRSKLAEIERDAYEEVELHMTEEMINDFEHRHEIIDRWEQSWKELVVAKLREISREKPVPKRMPITDEETTIGDATLPTAFGELSIDYVSSDDEDDASSREVEISEVGEIYSKVADSTLRVAERDVRAITSRWPIKRWEEDIENVLEEMRSHYAGETFRKRVTTMWKVAKHRNLDCVDTIEAVKKKANYKTITNRLQCVNNNEISKLEYGEIVQRMIDQKIPLEPETLFLVGLPARRVADVEALYIVDSPEEATDLERNYLIRDLNNIANSRLVWNSQKVPKSEGQGDYLLFDLGFLPNFAEICTIIRELPSGKYTNNNYYENTVKRTGWTPTNFRHYWFDHGKKNFCHAQWLFIIKCMNSSMQQAVTYCS